MIYKGPQAHLSVNKYGDLNAEPIQFMVKIRESLDVL